MIDRNTAPPAHKIQSIEFICPQTIEINAAVKLLWMKNVSNEPLALTYIIMQV